MSRLNRRTLGGVVAIAAILSLLSPPPSQAISLPVNFEDVVTAWQWVFSDWSTGEGPSPGTLQLKARQRHRYYQGAGIDNNGHQATDPGKDSQAKRLSAAPNS
ncbi:MAG TPA: hypothetical protein VHR45_12960 [Thermoanaerobaculia bacterium]|nr:hypothetical protein [Thermoanaerobaculia bacterium]